jgi:hypothetical protein
MICKFCIHTFNLDCILKTVWSRETDKFRFRWKRNSTMDWYHLSLNLPLHAIHNIQTRVNKTYLIYPLGWLLCVIYPLHWLLCLHILSIKSFPICFIPLPIFILWVVDMGGWIKKSWLLNDCRWDDTFHLPPPPTMAVICRRSYTNGIVVVIVNGNNSTTYGTTPSADGWLLH